MEEPGASRRKQHWRWFSGATRPCEVLSVRPWSNGRSQRKSGRCPACPTPCTSSLFSFWNYWAFSSWSQLPLSNWQLAPTGNPIRAEVNGHSISHSTELQAGGFEPALACLRHVRRHLGRTSPRPTKGDSAFPLPRTRHFPPPAEGQKGLTALSPLDCRW
jgi:hypothetical protein